MSGTRPSWVSDRLFPFTSRFLELDGHSVHYLDEGDGPVLLLLHGNPTWSFLYRHVVAACRDRFRCVALDYPGFGPSSAAPGYRFRPQDHAEVVDAFVEALDLRAVTMVVGDWGGPIGLAVAGRHPERVAGLVVTNSFAWPLAGDPHFDRFSALFGGPLGRWLIKRWNLFVNLLVPRGHAATRLTREEMDHYRRPFPTPARRLPTAILPRQLTRGSEFLATVEAGLARLADKPVLIVWGRRDIAFRAAERERFQRHFPDHTLVVIDAGHFVPDDAPAALVDALTAWFARGRDPGRDRRTPTPDSPP